MKLYSTAAPLERFGRNSELAKDMSPNSLVSSYSEKTFTRVIPLCEMESRVAVVTGANGGLGYAIACRLLDTVPKSTPLTIVITARYLQKAAETITKLREYAAGRELISFDYVLMDLSSLVSVIDAATQLIERYKHLDYVFCNAGGGDFTGIDWPGAVIEILTGPINAVTHPHYKRERSGRLSQDSIGWVFQINVLANYVFIRKLRPLLSNGGRVILVSSIETEISQPFDPDDMQILKSKQPYVESKKELMLMHIAIASQWEKESGIHVYITHPGICQTSIFAEYLNPITTFLMLGLFYFVRLLGSPWHVITAYKGATAAVWAATEADPEEDPVDACIYASACDRLGRVYIKQTPLENAEDSKNSEILIRELDRLTDEAFEKAKLHNL